MDFDKAKAVYLDRFKNVKDFEFFIVGDIKAETLKPLLEKYIAGIPSTSQEETWIDNSSSWLNDNIDRDIYLKMESPKSAVRVLYKNNIAYNLKNELLVRALGDILQLRYTESLREKRKGYIWYRSICKIK
ncbi:MAG: insulinase family protein [Chloroflexia bacterium]|nr:insulinase family protein [Chloroflexia bacterium]